MALTFGNVEEAVNEARASLARVDANVSVMARLCAGRLQHAHRYGTLGTNTLRDLKNELRRFNPHTSKWRP